MQLYQHDSPGTFRMVVKGDLGEAGAEGVRWAWETASSVLQGKDLIVDVSDVTAASPSGIELLKRMRGHGARIAAARRLQCERLLELLDRPAPSPKRDLPIQRALRFLTSLRSRV